MKFLKFGFLPALILVFVYILFFQAELLGISLNKNSSFPLGTVISWLIVFLYSLFFYVILPLKKKNLLQKTAKIILMLNVFPGAVWGVLSYFLAGNWNFIFEDKTAFNIWIGITLIVFLIPLLVGISLGIDKVIRKKDNI